MAHLRLPPALLDLTLARASARLEGLNLHPIRLRQLGHGFIRRHMHAYALAKSPSVQHFPDAGVIDHSLYAGWVLFIPLSCLVVHWATLEGKILRLVPHKQGPARLELLSWRNTSARWRRRSNQTCVQIGILIYTLTIDQDLYRLL